LNVQCVFICDLDLVKKLSFSGEFFNKVPFINTAEYQGFLKLCVLKTAFYV